jgi:predicted GIY-YIG superfamily endonuclease
MKKYYVYELINLYGTIEYVGETSLPKIRLYDHTRRKPNGTSTRGLFYGRQDLIMNIVQEFDDRRDARKFETELKIINGLPPTERNNGRKMGKLHGGIKNGIKGAIKTSKPILVFNKITSELVNEYSSIAECSRNLNLNACNVSLVASGKRTHTKGYTIKYKEHAK